MTTTQLVVRIPKALHVAVKCYVIEHDISMHDFILDAIKVKLEAAD